MRGDGSVRNEWPQQKMTRAGRSKPVQRVWMNANSVFESLGKDIISAMGDIVMRRRPACRLSRRQVSLYSPKTPKFTYLQTD